MTSVSMEVFKLSQKSNRSPPYTEIANVVGYEGNARSDTYLHLPIIYDASMWRKLWPTGF